MRGAEEGGPTRGCWHPYYFNGAGKEKEKVTYRYVIKLKMKRSCNWGGEGGRVGGRGPWRMEGKGTTLRRNPEDRDL